MQPHPPPAPRYFQLAGVDDVNDTDVTTVVLAEDDGALRTFLSSQLRRRGYRVIEAHHGGELLACVADFALRATPFVDVVVTDLVMPTATGEDALRAVRRLGSHVPLIVMSAFLDPLRDLELRAAGANATLAKPFAISELVALLPPARRARTAPTSEPASTATTSTSTEPASPASTEPAPLASEATTAASKTPR